MKYEITKYENSQQVSAYAVCEIENLARIQYQNNKFLFWLNVKYSSILETSRCPSAFIYLHAAQFSVSHSSNFPLGNY